MKNKTISILATDFSTVREDMEVWQEKREKKMDIYREFTELIEFLEQLLLLSDSLEKIKIEKQIKKLKKMRENYSVPSLLAMKFEKTKVLNLRSEE